MRKTREVLVVVLDAEGWNLAVRVVFKFLCVLGVVLRGENLHGNGDGIDFFLCEDRGVGSADCVDEVVAFGSESENSPAAWRGSV